MFSKSHVKVVHPVLRKGFSVCQVTVARDSSGPREGLKWPVPSPFVLLNAIAL